MLNSFSLILVLGLLVTLGGSNASAGNRELCPEAEFKVTLKCEPQTNSASGGENRLKFTQHIGSYGWYSESIGEWLICQYTLKDQESWESRYIFQGQDQVVQSLQDLNTLFTKAIDLNQYPNLKKNLQKKMNEREVIHPTLRVHYRLGRGEGHDLERTLVEMNQTSRRFTVGKMLKQEINIGLGKLFGTEQMTDRDVHQIALLVDPDKFESKQGSYTLEGGWYLMGVRCVLELE